MSVAFNDTSTYKGLVQLYEKEIGANRGDISGNSDKLKEFTADVNIALDEFFAIAFNASGTWQFDDSNHTAYPIITTNLVSAQRDYAFTVDEQSNIIIDIHKVLVADSSGTFHEVDPVDVQTERGLIAFQTSTSSGTPIKYDKTANAIFLDPIPSYNYTNGLKVYINREASYFTSSDTTKKPGTPGIFHEYFAICPAYRFAARNQSRVEASLLRRKILMEEAIKEHFGRRNHDERKRITASSDSNK